MQTIIAGAGAQTVWVYATDAHGRLAKPSGATARIVDLDYTEDESDDLRIVLATSAATVDSLSTTTTAIAGVRTADPRKVPITAGVPVVGVSYAISSAGNTEAFVVDRIDSLNIYAREALRFQHASGATVTGLRVSATFPSGRANDATELDRRATYGVDWTFTGTTGKSPVRTLCRIERRAVAVRATVSDLFLAAPRLEGMNRERNLLDKHIVHADEEITALLEHRGDQVANRDDGKVAKMAVVWRALELAYRDLPAASYAEQVEFAAREAARWSKMLLSGHKPDDAEEVARSTDARRSTRRATSLGLVTT